MPCSGCPVLHGVNPNFKKTYFFQLVLVHCEFWISSLPVLLLVWERWKESSKFSDISVLMWFSFSWLPSTDVFPKKVKLLSVFVMHQRLLFMFITSLLGQFQWLVCILLVLNVLFLLNDIVLILGLKVVIMVKTVLFEFVIKLIYTQQYITT